MFVRGERERLRNVDGRTSFTPRAEGAGGAGRGRGIRRKGKWTNDRAGSPSVSDIRAKAAVAADDENYAYNSARSLRNRPDVRALLCNDIAAVLRACGAARPFVTTRVPRAFQTGLHTEVDLEGRRIFHWFFSGPTTFSSFTVDGVRVFLFLYRKQNPLACTMTRAASRRTRRPIGPQSSNARICGPDE